MDLQHAPGRALIPVDVAHAELLGTSPMRVAVLIVLWMSDAVGVAAEGDRASAGPRT